MFLQMIGLWKVCEVSRNIFQYDKSDFALPQFEIVVGENLEKMLIDSRTQLFNWFPNIQMTKMSTSVPWTRHICENQMVLHFKRKSLYNQIAIIWDYFFLNRISDLFDAFT